MTELESKWNALMEKKKKLKMEEKALRKELRSSGLILVGDKILENKETFGLFWSLDYCSHYVGEHGMYMDRAKGACEISVEVFNKIEKLLRDLSTSESNEATETLSELLAEYIPLEDYVYNNMLSDGIISFKEMQAKWVTIEEGTNDGQMNPGSYFEIRKTTLNQIHTVKNVFEEDVCDS